MHFPPESLQNRFTFGHFLSREVAWSIKNYMLKMVIDPWPGVKSGGQWSIHDVPSLFITLVQPDIFLLSCSQTKRKRHSCDKLRNQAISRPWNKPKYIENSSKIYQKCIENDIENICSNFPRHLSA